MQRRTFLTWCAFASSSSALQCYGVDIIKDTQLNNPQHNGDIYVKWFGTDANAIQKANDLAFRSKSSVIFEDIDYIIDKPIRISTIWRGIPRKTRIIISERFSFQKSFDPLSYSAITNTNLETYYNPLTANYIELNGIDFIHRANENSAKETLALANIKGGKISNCCFFTETDSSSVVTPIDIFACVKNFIIENTKVVNNTKARAGGAIWIRNITKNGSNPENSTENIVIKNSSFSTSSVDEAIAIYGVFGMVKNIQILNSFISSEPSPVKHGTLASTFPLGKSPFAGVENILWDTCTFKSDNFQNHILRIGESSDSDNRCHNIRVNNCTFIADSITSNISYIARNIPCNGANIEFTKNKIYADTSRKPISCGISGFHLATNNTLSGKIEQGFSNCETVSYNVTKSFTGTAAFNCQNVHNNNFSVKKNGIVCNQTMICNIHDNKIQVETSGERSFGVIINSIRGSNPYATITGNKITLKNKNSDAIFVHSNLRKIIHSSNSIMK